jgi:hypothetical protein
MALLWHLLDGWMDGWMRDDILEDQLSDLHYRNQPKFYLRKDANPNKKRWKKIIIFFLKDGKIK